MKRLIGLVLAIACVFSLGTQSVFAADTLDIQKFVDNKKEDGYPSNNGKWTFDYVETVYKAGIITKTEKTKYSKNNNPVTIAEVIDLLTRIQYFDKTGKNYSEMQKDEAYKSIVSEFKYLPKYLQKMKLTKCAFCRYLSTYLKDSNIVYINSVELKDISDVTSKTTNNEQIIEVLKYGLLELDAKNNFKPLNILTCEELMKALSRIINPYYRATTKLYQGDTIEIQSETFPMYYKNYNEGIFIDITKERKYNTDCYIAKVIIDDPTHFKTIYSNLNWSNYGMEINRMDEKIDPILIVNGDFRSPYIARDKELGIVRNGKIVRENKFLNVLGMKKDGTLTPINENNAQAVLDLDIRETWTFGPWLVKDGKAVPGMDNKTNHPRTFFGQRFRDDGMLEYYLIVAEGRSSYDAGLSNYEMGQILEGLGVDIGYNLDGGGSSVMMFDGKLISRPSGGYFRADIDYIYIK